MGLVKSSRLRIWFEGWGVKCYSRAELTLQERLMLKRVKHRHSPTSLNRRRGETDREGERESERERERETQRDRGRELPDGICLLKSASPFSTGMPTLKHLSQTYRYLALTPATTASQANVGF